MKVRTRYAPSPTGYLHIGNARTALFAYLFAKHHGGDFIVRIEDTDTARNVADGEESQFDNLKWLGIKHDESVDTPEAKYGPYRQLERLDIYQKYANKMIEEGKAYKCYCTEEELEAKREANGNTLNYLHKCDCETKEMAGDVEYTIRVKSIPNTIYTWEDFVRGTTTFNSNDIADWVIMKKNGIPTYNFCVVVDDYLMEISHVIRGEEHISNTPKQMMIYEAFGWNMPLFGHTSLIMNENGKKLSKRDAHIIQFISQYREMGYLPDAIVNFLALLGWSPSNNQEIFTHEELIKAFSEERLSKSPAIFDVEKLKWMNNQYIKALSEEEYVALAKDFLESEICIECYEEDYFKEVVLLYKEQLRAFNELFDLSKQFFGETPILSEDAKAIIEDENNANTIAAFDRLMGEKFDGSKESIKAIINEVKEETGAKGKNLFMPIRVAATNQTHGPDLVTSIYLTKQNEKQI